MLFRVMRRRLESLYIYICYTWITWILTSTALTTNFTLDCSNSLVITSPGYPSPYQHNIFKTWYISAPRQRRILITFNDFSLEPPDYIEAIDVAIESYTGKNKQFPPYLTTEHTIQIEFYTSPRKNSKGFNISLSCHEPLTGDNFSARLVGGSTPSAGFLELSSTSGHWMRVCEESLQKRVAEVICGELGYPGVKDITYVNGSCLTEDLTQNCTKAPSCADYTYRLVDCTAGYSKCESEKAVKVECYKPGYKGCYQLKKNQLHTTWTSTFSSPAHCIHFCKTKGMNNFALINRTECVCSPSTEVNLTNFTECASPSESNVTAYDARVGFCEELNDPIAGSWDSEIMWFGSIVNLTCMDGYTLNGSRALQCVPGVTPYFPIWNEPIPDCEPNDITQSSESNGRMWKLWIGIPIVVLAICIVLAGYITYRKKLRNWKGIRRESEADSPISTSTHDRGGTSAISGRITGGSTRQNAVGSIDRSPSSNINPTITTIALSNVTQFAVPENTSEPLHTDAPPFLRLTGSNASSQTLPSLHQNNQRSINHYVSSPSAPNPYHYASSPDNSVDFVRLEAAYQEPSSVEIYNNAYEGTTDDVHSNIMLEKVNPYHYATSSAKMEVGGGSTLSYEEAYQVPSAIEMANHEYEGTFDDHEHSTAVLSGGISMAYRPLPHRPSSANCNEGPTLPPRKSSRGPTHFPMKQRESTMDTVNNNFPQACSLVSKGLRHIPKKHQQEKEGMGQDMTPFYHTLEKDERARSLGQDNQGLYLGEGHLPYSAPISTNSQGNTIRSRVHGNTDLTDTDRMIDNVLYVPMTSCQKKYSHF